MVDRKEQDTRYLIIILQAQPLSAKKIRQQSFIWRTDEMNSSVQETIT